MPIIRLSLKVKVHDDDHNKIINTHSDVYSRGCLMIDCLNLSKYSKQNCLSEAKRPKVYANNSAKCLKSACPVVVDLIESILIIDLKMDVIKFQVRHFSC
jgi:hypothetical protein